MNGYYTSGRFKQYQSKRFTPENSVLTGKINSVSYNGSTLYIACSNGLYILNNDTVSACSDLFTETNVDVVYCFSETVLYVAVGNGLYLIENGSVTRSREFCGKIVSVKRKDDNLFVLTEGMITKTNATFDSDVLNRPTEGGCATSFEIFGNGAYTSTQTNLSVLHGKRLEWQNIFPDRSGLPDARINDLEFDEKGFLWLGTDDGAYIYDTQSFWLSPKRISQLPQNSVRKICFDDEGGVYFATDVGVAMLTKGEIRYYAADRWVPSNDVTDIASSKDGRRVFAATAKGLAVITNAETTLLEKAEYYEEQTEKNNVRRGYVCDRAFGGDVCITDNDGLWTAWYVAGECFRYAVTGEKDALTKATRGMDALLFLEGITGIEGFPARAVRYSGENGFGNGHSEWSFSPDKSCEWRGDTSSDEITGHFFGSYIYWLLCADAEYKEKISKALCKICDHIINNSFRLVDRDGKPTTWANWNPELLNHDDRWFAERGTNSLEIMMYLKVCFTVSGDKRYEELYNRLTTEKHLLLNVVRYKIRDAHVCHIDDVLTYLSSIVLLMLEKNETTRKYIMCGLEDIRVYERVERQPLFSFVHAAFSDNDDSLTEGVRSLREMPLDLYNYASYNSARKGLVYDTEQEAMFEDTQLKEPLPYHEFNLTRPNREVFKPDFGSSNKISDGTAFLLPYWFGRYTGVLREDALRS